MAATTVEPARITAEQLADRYLAAAAGDPYAALRSVIGDALADFAEMERRTRCADRLLSRGFVRGRSLADLVDQI